ncbi:MAG: polynucleotide adenylyltransferase PcnB [Pseudomonadota bacterium]
MTRELLRQGHISLGALKVIRRLTEAGYQAYVVGGCVRDILLGKSPKDFDVATDAHPDEVRDLFRNARLIGKRFRIVHIRYGPEIVEVATFRAPHNEVETEMNFSEGGMILSDNIYGTFDEDVHRRDFTMNALYYQPETDTLVDAVDGLTDIENQRIRLIGEPEDRFREDPVRMLRAIRFKAKLGFAIDPLVEASMRRLGFLLQDIPPARLFEEVLKLFMNGHGEASFEELLNYELYGWLFPSSRRALEDTGAQALVQLALRSTDQRIQEGKPVTPAFVLAALLWHPYQQRLNKLLAEGMTSIAAGHEAGAQVIAEQQLCTSIPKRFSGPMRDIWSLQFRLPMQQAKKAETTMRHKRFRAAYDFLLLREESGEIAPGLGEWWTAYQQESDPEARAQMAAGSGGRRRRRRRRKSPAAS